MKKLSARQIVALAFLLMVMSWLMWGIFKKLRTDPSEKYALAFVALVIAFIVSLTMIRSAREFVTSHSTLFRASGILISVAGLSEMLYLFNGGKLPFGLDVSVWLGLGPILVGYLVATMPGMIKKYNERMASIDKRG